jgi:hypothetical protein
MKNPKKWIIGGLTAVFAAVAGTAVIGLTPALNGSQPDTVWQTEAQLAVEKSLPPFAKVEYVSTAPANAAGLYDSKILTFKVTGPFGRVSKKAEVRCNQEKENLGLRGGQINCEKPVISGWQFHHEISQ